MCIPHVLALLTEVAQSCLSHKTDGEDDQLSLTVRILTNIFQKVVEILAHRLRKDKEEGQEVRPIQQSVPKSWIYFRSKCTVVMSFFSYSSLQFKTSVSFMCL